jgi:hypothetical protein
LPTPASPITVAIRGPFSATDSSNSERSPAISASRPTIGASGRRVVASALDRVADGDQADTRDRLGLALERQRLDGLDLDRITDEVVGELSDQDLVRRRGLLEAGGGVHGIAGDQALAGRRVARHDLPGVDAGPVRQLDAPASLQLPVQLGQRPLHPGGGLHGPERVVLVERRQPEDGHDSIADELLDRPAVTLELAAHLLEVAVHHLAQRLGVERLAEVRRDPSGPRRRS